MNIIFRTNISADGSEIVDYVFDQIKNPILMMTSATTGRIYWAKNFLSNTEPNGKKYFNCVDNKNMYTITDVKMTDNLWIKIEKGISLCLIPLHFRK